MTLRTDASLDRAAFFNVFRAIADEDGKAVEQQEAYVHQCIDVYDLEGNALH